MSAMEETDWQVVNRSHRQLKAIPDDVLEHAECVVSLDISGSSFTDLSNLSLLRKFQNLTSLNLDDCGLRRLPEELFDLVKLQTLSLKRNYLWKGLNASIGKLKALKELNVEYCFLSDLPEELWSLEKLEKVSLSDNFLEKGLSNSISKLKALKELNVDFCRLSGIPDELWSLENLEKLSLRGNEMGLSASIGKLQALKELDVGWCELSDLTEEMWNLKKLEKLSLTGNKMKKGLSASIGKLQALKVLDVGGCELSDLPEELWNLKKLEKLSLWGSKMEKGVSSSISKLQAIKDLDVSFCQLSDLPEELWSLVKLEKLSLRGNKMKKGLSASISKLQALKELDVRVCELSDLPEELWSLENLEKLSLRGNKMELGLSASISKLQALKELDVSHCQLSDLPEELWSLEKLENLSLSRNKMKKGLSASISKLQALKELDVARCELSDLPEELWSLENLEKLSLSGNQMAHGLSASISKLQSLKELNIMQCALSNLPEDLWNLQKLEILKLSDNCLVNYPTGSLRLPKLHCLDLSNNLGDHGNCIKEIPLDFDKTCLEVLRLYGNPITVPPAGVWKQGVNAIKSYMKDIRAQGKAQFRPDTINMLGESMAGKTSIALSLVTGSPNATKEDDRTRVLEQHKLVIDQSSTVYINDFGGHPIYQSVIPIFLPFTGLSIIVYNLKDSKEDQQRNVEKWLLTAIAKSAQIRIVVVGTRSDEFSYDECLSLKERMETFVADVLVNLERNIEKAVAARSSSKNEMYQKLTALRSKLQGAQIAFATVSCKESANDFSAFSKIILDSLTPLEPMPMKWLLIMQDIFNKQKSGFPCRMMSAVQEIYKTHIEDDPKFEKLPIILRYLANSSQILWLEKNKDLKDFVFYSPKEIVDKCKKVLHHDKSSMELSRVYNDDVKLYSEGRLTMKLLRKMLLEDCGEKDPEVLCHFLKNFNLISELKSDGVYERMFAIAGNLPLKEPSELQEAQAAVRDSDSCVSVVLSLIGSVIPLSFFETSLLMIFTEIDAQFEDVLIRQWREGLLIIHDSVYLIMRRQKTDEKITLAAGSTDQKKNPWQIMSIVMTLLGKYIDDSWPGVCPNWIILCPECTRLKRNSEERTEGEAILDFEHCTSHLMERQSSKTSSLPFKGCGHSVPRIMCYPISQDDTRRHKIRPDVEPIAKRQASSPADAEGVSEKTYLQCKLSQARPQLVKELDSSSIDHIIDELTAARGGRGLISEEDSQLIMADKTVKGKARRLLDAIHKRGDDAIKVLTKALSSVEVDRDDLAEFLMGEEPEGCRRKGRTERNEDVTELRQSRKHANRHEYDARDDGEKESELQRRLREQTAEFAASLTAINVQAVATMMWSAGKLHITEFNAIKIEVENHAAVTALVETTYIRGDDSIRGLENALRKIERSDLANRLNPEGN